MLLNQQVKRFEYLGYTESLLGKIGNCKIPRIPRLLAPPIQLFQHRFYYFEISIISEFIIYYNFYTIN